MKAISLRLDNAQYERLRVLSFATRQPVAEIVRAAIDTHLRQAAEKEAEADLAAGRVETYENDAAFLASLV